MNKYQLIIWDVDGTLLDTSEGIIAAAKYTISSVGYSLPSEVILQKYIGPPIQDSFAKTLNLKEEESKKLAYIFRKRYKDHDLFKAKPYEGIMDVLKMLHINKVRQGIATYKRYDYAREIVKHFGFDNHADIIEGADFAGHLTKKDIIAEVIHKANITDLKQVVMIGDTDNDLQGAKQLGINFIAVTYGFGFTNGAEIKYDKVIGIANDVSELKTILELQYEN